MISEDAKNNIWDKLNTLILDTRNMGDSFKDLIAKDEYAVKAWSSIRKQIKAIRERLNVIETVCGKFEQISQNIASIENIEKEQISKLTEGKNIPNFKPGDTLKVHTKVKEGDRERIQVYEGVCIARKNDGLNSSFTVRKISFGEGVERVFPLYSPNVAKIEVARIGKVRRAKLYFLRALRGRSARIADDLSAQTKKNAD